MLWVAMGELPLWSVALYTGAGGAFVAPSTGSTAATFGGDPAEAFTANDSVASTV